MASSLSWKKKGPITGNAQCGVVEAAVGQMEAIGVALDYVETERPNTY